MANHHDEILRRCWSWSRSHRDLWDCEGFAESEVLLAAHQLMQLSHRENGSGSIISENCRGDKKKKKQRGRGGVELEPEQAVSPGVVVTSSSSSSSSSSGLLPVEEVFRGEEEGIYWLKKRRRRYRDLADIYDATATPTDPVKCQPIDRGKRRMCVGVGMADLSMPA